MSPQENQEVPKLARSTNALYILCQGVSAAEKMEQSEQRIKNSPLNDKGWWRVPILAQEGDLITSLETEIGNIPEYVKRLVEWIKSGSNEPIDIQTIENSEEFFSEYFKQHPEQKPATI